MDRPIDSGFRRRRLLKRVLASVGIVGGVVLLLFTVAGWIRPSVRRQDIRTAKVDRGPVEATVSAAGTVVPIYEQVITSPIESRVMRILLTPGAAVEAGQPIVLLDASETAADVEELDDQIALKRNQREQARLSNARERDALLTRREIKALELQSREYEAERCRKHFAEGLFSQDEVRRAETDAEKARIELREIDESLETLAGDLETQLRGLDLEIAIHRRDREEKSRRLDLSTAASDRRGVLSWVVPSEGMAVRRGDELARVTDLSAFRVEATISDIHAARVAPGLPVIVRSGKNRVGGRVRIVRPTVQNGIITLEVDLDEATHPILRHNLRVDVYVISDRVEDALRVKRGPYMTPDGTHAVFVLRGDRAVRTPVEFGLTNIDCYQVLDGLEEGDEVIVSDMSKYVHVREVLLR